jgi:acyl carrier protein
LDEATSPSTVAEQVEAMVKGLTGLEVTRSTNLHGIGLDSLGTTALLSILRTSVDQAKNLTMQELARFQNVGDLVDFLHAIGEEESPERKEDVV